MLLKCQIWPKHFYQCMYFLSTFIRNQTIFMGRWVDGTLVPPSDGPMFILICLFFFKLPPCYMIFKLSDFFFHCATSRNFAGHNTVNLMTRIKAFKILNRQYMKNLTLVSLVKMGYGWNFSISGLKMMMKSGLGKLFLKILHALTMSFLLLNFDQ